MIYAKSHEKNCTLPLEFCFRDVRSLIFNWSVTTLTFNRKENLLRNKDRLSQLVNRWLVYVSSRNEQVEVLTNENTWKMTTHQSEAFKQPNLNPSFKSWACLHFICLGFQVKSNWYMIQNSNHVYVYKCMLLTIGMLRCIKGVFQNKIV